MDAGRTLVGAAKPLELRGIAQIRAQDLVVLGLETDQSVVRLRFLAMQAQQSQAFNAGAVWKLSPGPSGPSIGASIIKRDTVGVRIDGTILHG